MRWITVRSSCDINTVGRLKWRESSLQKAGKPVMKDAGVGVISDSEGQELDGRIKCRQQAARG